MNASDAGAASARIVVAELRIAVHASPRDIASDWRALEQALPVSVYQSFDWIDCWVEAATVPQRIRPTIVSIRREERLVAILPLGIEQIGPLRVARFLGGGVLMVLLTERPVEWSSEPPHPLLRPFLGTGFCGGFTTFSTYSLETERLLSAGDPARGLLYLGATAVTALLGVAAGVAVTRAVRPRRERA